MYVAEFSCDPKFCLGHRKLFTWSMQFFSSIKNPHSVLFFGGNPFAECGRLSVIDVSENQDFVLVDGVLMEGKENLIIYCDPTKSGDYSIPSTVTIIGVHAFHECVKQISTTIPDSVECIEK